MKLLLVQSLSYVPTHGGANKGNRALIEALSARGHDCRVVTLASESPGPDALQKLRVALAERKIAAGTSSEDHIAFQLNDVTVYAVGNSLDLRTEMKRQMRDFKPDRTLISCEDPGQAILEAALETRTSPVVLLVQTTLPLPFGPGSFLASEQKTELLKSVDGIVANCQFLADYMREWGGLESTVLRFPAFGTPPFSQVTGARDGFVMFVNPSAMKGISIFLELARSLPEIRFATVPTWGTTKEDRRRLGELPNVTILNATDNIDDIFAITRVLLVPSLWSEAVGYIGIEAMSRGIPVLGSDVGGMRESKLGVDYLLPVTPITQFEDRFDERRLPVPIVPEQDTRPWRDALVKVVSDQAHYESLSEASRKATLNFLSQIRVEHFEKYFESLANSARPGGQQQNSRTPVSAQSVLDSLSPEKRALLALRLKRRAAAKTSETNGLRRRNSTSAPLSFSQQRLWFLEQLEPDKAVSNIPAAIQLSGELDVAALAKALEQIVSRHEILRTTFSDSGAELLQTVAADARPFLEFVDLRSVPQAERMTRADQIMFDDARQSFDLVNGPPLRAILLCLSDTEHILLLTLHHIVSDGWSIGVLCREVGTLYESYLRNETSSLPELTIQYSDFAIAQRERFEHGLLQKDLEYWRKQLDGCPSSLDLPFGRQPSTGRSISGAKIVSPVAPAVWKQVEELAERRNVTVFMLLMACFQTLLYRYTNQKDICVSSPIAGRNLAETENVIGCFLNTLVFRSILSEDLTFLELLEQVKTVALGAYAHQDFPFEKLVEELRPERKLNSTPFSTVLFALHNLPALSLTLPGVVLKRLEREYPAAVFDLMLSTEAGDEGVACSWIYSTDLFDAETIERLARHFQLLLQSIVASPSTRLSELQFLGPAERRQLLYEWNETKVPRAPQLLHELIAQQAQATPEAVAVVDENQSLTYRELEQRANQLAHYLRQRGVGPDVLVGICLERSIEVVVGLLGILKAGGAYVPLDPSYPTQRLAMMLEDSGLKILLTQQHLLKTLPAHAATIVCVDDDRNALSRNSKENPPLNVTAGNLAYVIFTSGSTGRPKGVQIEHGAVVNFLASMRDEPGLASDDVLLAVTTLSFDIAGLELFLPLVVGAREVLVSREVASDGTQLRERLNGITVMQATPATYRLLLDAGCDDLSGIKILCGGEAFPRELANQLIEKGATVWNMYGPTESTIWSAVSRVEMEDGAVAIGRPIANTQIYVLDQRLQPVPPGVAGELCIGGDGLARGYFGAPALTAEKFVPNPFGAPGARLYRTGDLARFRSHGEIEYLGRFDEQIKLRGFRIELGEIETVLRRHQQVRDAVVVLREVDGDKRLVAYVIGEAAAGELRAFLKAQLPDYMAPSAFVPMKAFPLTASGKLNRRALPAPDGVAVEDEYQAPRTQTEELLSGLWASVLCVPRVGVRDNFFELGGHSLLATQLVSRVREAFGVELPLRELFARPTVAGLAEQVETALRGGERVAAAPLAPVSRQQQLPLSHAQERLWFLDQLEPGDVAYNIPGAVRLKGQLDVEALRRTLNEVARRHEVLRTRFVAVNGAAVQVIAPASHVEMPLFDLSKLPEEQREAEAVQFAAVEAQRPFDLSVGPLLRAQLLRLGAEDHVVLFTMHHIIADGWSTGILVREVAALYEAYIEGRESPLPELEIQYADYAVWQREWLQGEVLEEQLGYWRQQLGEELPVLQLPTDKPRPPVQSHRGRSFNFTVPAELTAELKQLSNAERVTLYMTLLAAFKILLWRYSGQSDVVVGTPIAGRNHLATEGLIGLFVNTLVLRTSLSGNPSFSELLERVREVSLGAYAHQDLPFEKLVEELQPERDMSRSPLFQVMFLLQNATAETLRLPGLEASEVGANAETAKFDLTLGLAETDDRLVGSLQYNLDLFDAATIERLVQHYQLLLEDIVADPHRPLSQLPLLLEEDRHKLLVEWNDTREAFANDKCVHELFEEQVSRTPGAVAVMYEDTQLTYAELNARANQLARYLQRHGVGLESRVGLCLERSLDLVVAILGVLKAGAAYVALDPQYPAERLQYMLADANAQMLVTHKALTKTLTDYKGATLFLDQQQISEEEEANLTTVTPEPDSVAYVIYTSGSTGQPKGVMVQHASVVNLAAALQRAVYDQLSDGPLRVGLNASLAFDASVKQWVQLLAGNTLVLAPEELRREARELLAYVEQQQIAVLDCTPAQLQMLFEAGFGQQQSSLIALLVGGEAISPELWQQLQQVARIQYFNVYGPTECTVDTTVCLLGRESARVTIGRPLTNVQVYILDQQQQPVPVGVVGELCIGGAGVARGYLDQPGLTAESFVPDAFGGEAGARLYRSGDLVRYLPDGQIEFLGRMDQQVKVRGFRIELEGIRALLNSHPSIHDSVVTVQQDARRNQLLVAYYVSDQKFEAAELREWLRPSLLEETIPGLFIHLKEMPLTRNGKIDRSALPGVEDTREKSYSATTAPQNLTEEIVGGIWSHVLGINNISGDASFFELGGHSLLATQVVSRVRKAFTVELLLPEFFKAPTITALAKAVNAKLAQGQRTTVNDIPLAGRNDTAPLSYSQQRLWFLNQLAPDSPFYNVSGSIHLQGSLDVRALERAFNEVVRRHEVLRTSFPTVNGAPVQQINEWAPIELTLTDLSVFAPDVREKEIVRLTDEDARQIFDLTSGPLLSTTLLKLGADEYLVRFTVHHIISDGWSIAVLVREFASLYRAFSSGQPSPLPELRIQYADYAIWQRNWLQGEVLNQQLDYWKDQLAGAPSLLQLPIFKARPSVQSFRGDKVEFRLSAELSAAVRKLSGSEGVTLFITLMAAFQTLLYRYTGQTDILVGSPLAGRNYLDTEDLIGFFVNTVALRSKLRPDMTFLQLLDHVREAALGAHAHQDLPFERLVEELQPERNLSYSPVFQVLFVLRNTPALKLELPGLQLTVTGLQSETAKFDLILVLTDSDDGLFGAFEYNIELFEPELIERLKVHFTNLLQSIVAEPSANLSQLPMLDEAERRELIHEINDTTVEYPQNRCIHELFEEQAARTPHALATVFQSKPLSYGELNRRANQLAHYLRRAGVRPETLVGIAVEPSVEMVVGMLAILKAGAAYVPLDPEYPMARLLFMIEDAGLSVLLTQKHLLDALSQQQSIAFRTALKVLYLDADWPITESEENPASKTDADNLAYVIYTSGSTGVPKGVAVSHRAVLRLVCNTNYVELNDSAVIGQASNTSFDALTFELWGALLHGGRLVGVSRELALSPKDFSAEITRLGINTLFLTTALFNQIARSAPQAFASLRYLLFGGEAVDVPCVRAVLEQGTPEQLLHVYGPTENTTFSSYHGVRSVAPDAVTVPIGGPIANTQAYVLDPRLEPAPVGVAGELYVGGEGLARGYLRRPELTADKFVPNPFGPAGTRLYRTGDVVRLTSSRDIEFLGRVDEQIKMRGFRIDLAEIEVCLRKEERVRDAVVMVRETSGDKQIVAFVAPADTGAEGPELRERLKQQLPGFMVPSAIFVLSQLPITPGGKVDRQELLAMAGHLTMQTAESLPPETETEHRVAQIWSEVLNTNGFGINDNFFDLGGHSLRAAQVTARINEVFDVVMPVRTLFESPTIANLADNIDVLRWLKSGPDNSADNSITLQMGEL